jgi:iron complex transport system ATP-binding protein
MTVGRSPIISVHSATVAAENGARILNEISFDIHEGEHTAILGPNGSGKSSLIKLITQHFRPYASADAPYSVTLFGRERWNVFELRAHLGIVSADLHHTFRALHGWIKGFDAVLTGFFASEELFRHHEVTDEMRERAHAAIALMEAEHLSGKPLEEMSTGEARRILIARALAPDPRALILDEPTTGLDLAATRHFLETLREIARSGKTVILVTHHVEEIFPEIQHVVLLNQGRIVFDGPKQEALTSEKLSAAYEASVQVEKQPHGYYEAGLAQAGSGA